MTGTLGLVVTIVVMVGIAVFILLFERKRARQIESDLRHPPEDPGSRQARPPSPPDAHDG